MSRPLTARSVGPATTTANPWNALWALLVGFFMILVDATIVAVANPAIMAGLGADYDTVIWVTSAYLLAYAVPLLLAGRLGDRFGPKNLYIVGLAVFTAASLWCGLAGSIEMLIAARVVQGVGAALLTPQTLSTITRIFPPERRGVALSVWGATAGVATLVGPLAGGVLVDGLGWQWIFFVNVPIGVVGLGLAVWLIPVLPTRRSRFDVPGVLLSGIGMFLIVFALQEGQSHQWSPWIWGMLAGGAGFMVAFVYWQHVSAANEPLIPLRIFGDRDFTLSNLGIATIGFVVTAMIVPVMFYAQAVRGLSPTQAALLTAPMAIATGVLAPWVGRIVDRSHPRPVIGFGFSLAAIALTWLSFEMEPATPIWRLVLPLTAMGVGMAFIWSPLAATATRNLPPELAGAGSGVYNTTRQVGSVLGSASMAAFMTSRIGAEMPSAAAPAAPRGEDVVTRLPDVLHAPFAAAMSQSTLLPAFVALFGVVAAMFLLGFGGRRDTGHVDKAGGYVDDHGGDAEGYADGYADEADGYADDDEYVEYTVEWHEPELSASINDAGDAVTEPIPTRVGRGAAPRPATRDAAGVAPSAGHGRQADTAARGRVDEPVVTSSVEWIGFSRNGFHVDDAQRFRPLAPPVEPEPTLGTRYSTDSDDRRPRHRRVDDEAPDPGVRGPGGRHSRTDPDDASSYGRHAGPS